jgi:riboflavin synthase
LFSGIVEGMGVIRRVGAVGAARAGGHVRLSIDLGTLAVDLDLGSSVAINGVCLTLAAKAGSVGEFDVIPETLRCTNLGTLAAGCRVNLERSLRAGARVDGHFVQGHVDGTGIVERVDRGAEVRLWVRAESELSPYLVRKGSVAIDGVSLTIAETRAASFAVALIPTTLERTVLSERRVADRVNLETDVLARIVVERVDAYLRRAANGGALASQLRDGGFMP